MALTYPFVLNGNSYDLTAFQNTAYVTGLPNSMSDFVRQILLLPNAASTTSTTIGTGSKVFATTGGKSFFVGALVRISSQAAPQTNYMYGNITAYNFSTGSMTVNVVGTFGSGTIASWFITLGGMQAAFVGDALGAIDNGMLGAGRDTFVQQGGMLGLGEPSMNMVEIYEEFAGSQGELSASPVKPGRDADPPWFSSSLGAFDAYQSGSTDATRAAGYFLLQPTATRLNNAILQYNSSGFLHAGRGAIRYETNLYNVANSNKYYGRCGLKTDGAVLTKGLFAYGGIGFEWDSLSNGGRYICAYGAGGVLNRKVTSISPSASIDRLAFDVDTDGTGVDFYINDALVLSITDVTLPVSQVGNLMSPSYEAGWTGSGLGGGGSASKFYIDSMFLSKFLAR